MMALIMAMAIVIAMPQASDVELLDMRMTVIALIHITPVHSITSALGHFSWVC